MLSAHRRHGINQLRGLLNANLLPAPGAVLYSTRSLAVMRVIELPTSTLTLCFRTLLASLTALQEQIEQLARLPILVECVRRERR